MAKKQEKTPTKPKKPVKKKRKSYVTRPSTAELIKIEERRNLVVDLSKTGLSIRQISIHLKAKGYEKVSPATICEDLTTALQQLADARVKNTELLVEMELNKLDDWEFQLNLDLKQPKPSLSPLDDKLNIIYALLKVQDRRDRFLTLSKREKSKINAREALAKLAGIPIEQIPDGAK